MTLSCLDNNDARYHCQGQILSCKRSKKEIKRGQLYRFQQMFLLAISQGKKQLTAQIAVLQTARNAYSNALKEALPDMSALVFGNQH
jgi:hypothetical protein